MKASSTKVLLAVCAMAPAIVLASENPFIPSPADGSAQMELRLQDLEIRAQRNEQRLEEMMMENQFPGLRAEAIEQAVTSELSEEGVEVIGKLNGDCLIRRTNINGQVVLDRIKTDAPCVNAKSQFQKAEK